MRNLVDLVDLPRVPVVVDSYLVVDIQRVADKNSVVDIQRIVDNRLQIADYNFVELAH